MNIAAVSSKATRSDTTSTDWSTFEVYSTARDAIQREKNIKHWPRAWKTRLIAQSNPTWARSV
jgi:predicted GIY-YIG superfamily endonuclease